MRELKSHLASRQSLSPQLRTATATGSSVDRAGFESVTFNIHFGAWTDGAHAVTLEDSDDDSDFDAVVSDFIVGDLPTATVDAESPPGPAIANENVLVGYVGHRRYVRPVVTVSGGPGTGAFIGIDVLLGHAHDRPTT